MNRPLEHQEKARLRSDKPSIWLLLIAVAALPGIIGYAMAAGDETQVFAIALASCAAIACLWQPFAGLLIFLTLFYTRPEESIPVLAGMHFTLIVAILTLIGMAVQFSVDRIHFVRSPVIGMTFGVLLASVASVLPGGDITVPGEDMGRYLILVFLILNLVRTKDRYDSFVTAIICLSVYLSAYSLYLYFSGQVVIKDDGEGRSQGTGIFADPNDLAAAIVPAVALALQRFNSRPWAQKWLYGTAIAVLLIGIITAASRGGLIALMVTAIGSVLISKASKSTKTALILGTVMVFLSMSGRITNFDTQEASANSRFWFWYNGVNQLMAHPLLGVGYNQFSSVNGGFVAHNSFVQCFAEIGLIGYFFWIGATYFAMRHMHAWPKGLTTPGSGAAKSARLALTAYLVASFWLSHTFNPQLYVVLCVPKAADAAAVDEARGNVPESSLQPVPIRKADYGYIAAICLGSILFIKFLADHYR